MDVLDIAKETLPLLLFQFFYMNNIIFFFFHTCVVTASTKTVKHLLHSCIPVQLHWLRMTECMHIIVTCTDIPQM